MTDLGLFAGRFHPLLVHFPIGILMLAVALHVLAWWRARPKPAGIGAAATAAPTLVFTLGALAAILAASTGYLLGASGDYAGDTFARHQTLGITVAILACWTALAARLRNRTYARDGGAFWRRMYALSVTIMLMVLTLTGHLGATLTHGEGYLTEHAPAPLRAMLARLGMDVGQAAAGPGAAGAAAAGDQALVYAALVEPVLRARCVSCHGAAKSEGGLRLDAPDGLRKGGNDGPVIAPGQAEKSPLVRRIWLPASHPDVMPPRGQRPLMPAEASLIRWWIDRGAKFDQKIADASLTPDVLPAIEAAIGPIERGGPALPRVPVAAADPAVVAKVQQTGVAVGPVAAGTPFVHVHCTNVRAAFGDTQLAALQPLASQILWLDVSDTRLTDAGLAIVARFPNLTRLHLNRTAVTDAGLAHLARLERLEYLNLYGTRITDAGLAQLSGLRSLRALHVWQTEVTPDGIARLKSALPKLAVTSAVDATTADTPAKPAETVPPKPSTPEATPAAGSPKASAPTTPTPDARRASADPAAPPPPAKCVDARACGSYSARMISPRATRPASPPTATAA